MNNTHNTKPIPQAAIDSLPDGYTILGWGGDFEYKEGLEVSWAPQEVEEPDEWRDLRDDWVTSVCACDELFAAPYDSEIVELNRKAGKLPDLSQNTPSTCDKKIYIAGPMRGKEFFNFPAFDAARDKLVHEGWEVISPADIDRAHGFDAMDLPVNTNWDDLSQVAVTREECFDRDMEAIRHDCSAIYMLKGWQTSTGAQAEYWAARWLGLDIYYEEESICEEAFRIQGGDRQQDYGDPTQNFQDIANLWNAYFRMNLHQIDMQARDVAHMMILMKIARNCHKAKRDNWTDIAGYAQCGGKIDKV